MELSPVQWAVRPLSKYATFLGRAPRAEYWWFYLLLVVLYIVAKTADSVLGTGFEEDAIGWVSMIVLLVTLIPFLAASVRRLHDIDKSGWWMLLIFIPLIGAIWLIVLMVMQGTKGDNRFGPDPYGANGERHAA